MFAGYEADPDSVRISLTSLRGLAVCGDIQNPGRRSGTSYVPLFLPAALLGEASTGYDRH